MTRSLHRRLLMFRDLARRIRDWFRSHPIDRPPPGTFGEPGGGNGASSFHAWWEMPPGPGFIDMAVELEILERPVVDRIQFWAMQMTFVGASGAEIGGSHIGLQHHPNYPGRTAVNWGGYEGNVVVDGSVSPLPSAPNDRNTLDYPWLPRRRYRLHVFRSPDAAPAGKVGWRGTVTDTETGRVSVIRDLWLPGERMVKPVVWTEAFARCDHPSSAVRWSGFEATTVDGAVVRPGAVVVRYQSLANGGCTNTNTELSGRGLIQRTNTTRRNQDGVRIPLL